MLYVTGIFNKFKINMTGSISKEISFFEEIQELVVDVAHTYMFVPASARFMYTHPVSLNLLKVNN